MKNIIGIVVLIIVGAIAYYLLREDSTVTVNTEDYKDFAIEDTAAVDQIFMSQNNGKKILLSRRENGIWMVNGEFPARKGAINLILKTLNSVKIRGNVAKEDMRDVIKRLATSSTKVEFYAGDGKPAKTWYIGHPTPNRMGTYMLLEKEGKKSSKPYVTHLLSEKGYLSARFFLEPLLWKDRVVMKTDPESIKSVEIKHYHDTSTSFRIDQYELGKFKMTNLRTYASNELPAVLAVPYLKNFKAVFYEYIDQKTGKEELDSIYATIPRHTVRIETQKGEEFIIKTFNMPVIEGAKLGGKLINYHPERMYAYSSFLGKDVHLIVQNLTFDPLVPSLEDFESSTTVEK